MKDELVYLKSIVENIDTIFTYLEKDITNDALYDAIMYKLICIGEGALHTSKANRENNPHIPWKRIIGFRNIITHNYLGVNEDDVWTIVKNHLPELKKNIEIIIKDLESKNG